MVLTAGCAGALAHLNGQDKGWIAWVKQAIPHYEAASEAASGTSDDPKVVDAAVHEANACSQPGRDYTPQRGKDTANTKLGSLPVDELIERCRTMTHALAQRPLRGCGVQPVRIESHFVAGGSWTAAEVDPTPRGVHHIPCGVAKRPTTPPADLRAATREVKQLCVPEATEIWFDSKWVGHENALNVVVARESEAYCFFPDGVRPMPGGGLHQGYHFEVAAAASN